ncbi:hypothetical protein QO002_003782 [Pararhizobium capsulatum DSM 1112]|uniref:Phytase-like domain-containing protein n=1 Tax=Pararhizobium capsulatum DSM 1112 TaxID=1121113 RepID=A0ABU0BTT4_9HYPH|nr:hypothetical protein [Pararhizobium capsulatum DSM 1112]
MRATSIALCAALLLQSASFTYADPLPPQEVVPVESRQITNFKIGSDDTVFGKLEFIGGIEMSSSNALLGAISSIRFRPDHQSFVAVMDTGHWLEGRIVRDANGKLSGVKDLTATSMMDKNGRSEQVKSRMDAEGLAFRNGEVLVSCEGLHRVDAYPDPGFSQAKPLRSLPLLLPVKQLRDNRSLETLAVAPLSSPLGGAAVIVTEASFDRNNHLFAAILDGPLKGTFGVIHKAPFAVTDGAFLPNGDLLLLERRFSFSQGIGMQIRRIPGSEIRPGAVAKGEVLMQADMGNQIDNMEGLDIVIMPDGDIRIILVSDDNHSILERNLMLEFRLKQ